MHHFAFLELSFNLSRRFNDALFSCCRSFFYFFSFLSSAFWRVLVLVSVSSFVGVALVALCIGVVLKER